MTEVGNFGTFHKTMRERCVKHIRKGFYLREIGLGSRLNSPALNIYRKKFVLRNHSSLFIWYHLFGIQINHLWPGNNALYVPRYWFLPTIEKKSAIIAMLTYSTVSILHTQTSFSFVIIPSSDWTCS